MVIQSKAIPVGLGSIAAACSLLSLGVNYLPKGCQGYFQGLKVQTVANAILIGASVSSYTNSFYVEEFLEQVRSEFVDRDVLILSGLGVAFITFLFGNKAFNNKVYFATQALGFLILNVYDTATISPFNPGIFDENGEKSPNLELPDYSRELMKFVSHCEAPSACHRVTYVSVYDPIAYDMGGVTRSYVTNLMNGLFKNLVAEKSLNMSDKEHWCSNLYKNIGKMLAFIDKRAVGCYQVLLGKHLKDEVFEYIGKLKTWMDEQQMNGDQLEDNNAAPFITDLLIDTILDDEMKNHLQQCYRFLEETGRDAKPKNLKGVKDAFEYFSSLSLWDTDKETLLQPFKDICEDPCQKKNWEDQKKNWEAACDIFYTQVCGAILVPSLFLCDPVLRSIKELRCVLVDLTKGCIEEGLQDRFYNDCVETPKDTSERLQGHLDRDKVESSILQGSEDSTALTLLTRWVRAPQTTDDKIKQFLTFTTGSEACANGCKIEVSQGDATVFFTSSTCVSNIYAPSKYFNLSEHQTDAIYLEFKAYLELSITSEGFGSL